MKRDYQEHEGVRKVAPADLKPAAGGVVVGVKRPTDTRDELVNKARLDFQVSFTASVVTKTSSIITV